MNYSCPICNYEFKPCISHYHDTCIINYCNCYSTYKTNFSLCFCSCRSNLLHITVSKFYNLCIRLGDNKTSIYIDRGDDELVLTLDYCLDPAIVNDQKKCIEYIDKYSIYI